jgi:hypothetical protein
MLTLLAQSAPSMPDVDPGFLKSWIAVGGYILGLVGLGIGIFSKRRVTVSPNPVQVQVQPTPNYVTQEKMDDLEERMSRFEVKIERSFDDLKKSRSEDIAHLHQHLESSYGKIESHFKDLMELQQSATKTAFDRMDLLNTRVGRVEGRLEQKGGKGA